MAQLVTDYYYLSRFRFWYRWIAACLITTGLLLLTACTATNPVAPFHGSVAGQTLFLPGGHHKPVNQLAFSPSGRYCATVSYDRAVKVWDVQTRKVLANLYGHDRGVMGVAFSPDETRVASADLNGFIRVWDWRQGKEIVSIHASPRPMSRMVFYPDGSTLIGTGDDGFIRIWSLPEGRLLKESAAHKKPILGLALNPDTQTLYTAGFDRKIKAWSLDDLSLTDTWEVPGGVTWLTLSPDNTRLAVSLLTKQAVILDADTGEPLTTLSGHTKPVSGIVFFPDSARTATTSLDGSLRLFDKNGALVHILTPENPDKMTTLAINPQNPSEVWSGGWFNHLWVWDITEPALSRTITASFSPVFSLDLSRDGRFLAAGSQNTGVAVWQVTEDPVTGVPAFYRHTFQDQTIPCWSLALHPDQPVLAYTDTEGFIHVLDLATNEFLHHTLVEPMIPSKIIKRLEIDPSGEVLAASDASKVVMLRLSDMAFLRKIGGRDKKKGKPLGTSHFIPEPSLLMAGIGHTVQFFDSTPTPGNSGARFTIDTGMPGVVTALAVSSDQRFLAAMNSNGELQVRTFSLENESRRLFSWQLTDREGENCQGKNLVFSKDSRHLIAGTETGDLVVYHLLETDPVHHISAHPGGVNALEISPDGQYVYSAGEDSVVRVWSWPDLTLHSTLAAGPNGFAEERH